MIDISGRAKTGRPKKRSYREGRTRQLNIRLSDRDMDCLNELASFYGVTKTDLVLLFIERGVREMNKQIEERYS